MNLVSFFTSFDDLKIQQQSGVKDIIVSSRDFSRYGKIKLEDINQIAKAIKEQGMCPILEWDILMTEMVFAETIKLLSKIDLNLFESIRVQDPGAIHFVMTKWPEKKIQLVLETGNHNLQGILDWTNYVGKQLDRVILSIELPYETLKTYFAELKSRGIQTEILGLGRILLFYTPRSLLAPVLFDHDDEKQKMMIDQGSFERLASSEESPHKGFPILETKHGTFMFHIKEHCLVTVIPKLLEMNLDYLRIDLRFGKPVSLIKEFANLLTNFSENGALAFKNNYPSDTMLGFFNINKTDTLFTKLKNQKIQRQDENYLGDVYEICKDKHIAFMNRSKHVITKDMKLKIVNPEGKELLTTINWLKNSKLEATSEVSKGQLALIGYVGKVAARSQVYLA